MPDWVEGLDIIDYNIPKEFRNAKIKNADLQYEEFESVRSTIFKNNVERERNGEGLTYSSVAYSSMHTFDYNNYSLTDFKVNIIKAIEEEYIYDNRRIEASCDRLVEKYRDARRNSKGASKLSGNKRTVGGNDRLSSDRRGKDGNGSNLENEGNNRDRGLSEDKLLYTRKKPYPQNSTCRYNSDRSLSDKALYLIQ